MAIQKNISKQVGFRISPRAIEQLQELAAHEMRSATLEIQYIINLYHNQVFGETAKAEASAAAATHPAEGER